MTTSERLVEMLENGYMIVFEHLGNKELIGIWSSYDSDEQSTTGKLDDIVKRMYDDTVGLGEGE